MVRYEYPEDRDMRSTNSTRPRDGITSVYSTLGESFECKPINRWYDDYDYTAPEHRDYELRDDGALHKSVGREDSPSEYIAEPNVYMVSDVYHDIEGYAVYVLVLRHPLEWETEETIAIGSGIDTTSDEFDKMYNATERIYVGRSKNPNRRVREHLDADGHMITRHWKPIGLIDLIDGMSASQSKKVEQRLGEALQYEYEEQGWYVYIS